MKEKLLHSIHPPELFSLIEENLPVDGDFFSTRDLADKIWDFIRKEFEKPPRLNT